MVGSGRGRSPLVLPPFSETCVAWPGAKARNLALPDPLSRSLVLVCAHVGVCVLINITVHQNKSPCSCCCCVLPRLSAAPVRSLAPWHLSSARHTVPAGIAVPRAFAPALVPLLLMKKTEGPEVSSGAGNAWSQALPTRRAQPGCKGMLVCGTRTQASSLLTCGLFARAFAGCAV